MIYEIFKLKRVYLYLKINNSKAYFRSFLTLGESVDIWSMATDLRDKNFEFIMWYGLNSIFLFDNIFLFFTNDKRNYWF